MSDEIAGEMCTPVGAASLKELKAVFRQDVAQVLKGLSKAEVERQSRIVQQKVITGADFAKAGRISIYLHMPGEIQTETIIRAIFETGKKCFVPRFRVQDKRMDMVRLRSMEDYRSLPTVKWNIKQPDFRDDREDALESGGLDLVICPGLAFSPNGRRLGRGMGFYDSFLRRCEGVNPSLRTVGLALREQVFPNVPSGPADYTLDQVVYSD